MLTRTCLLLSVLALVQPANAGDVCDFYQRTAPDLYRLLCAGGKRSPKTAGAHSTFASGFNLNPGSLPSEPTSFGLEGILSGVRTNGALGPGFALVKGYHKIGTGVSTTGNETFYGNDLLRRLKGQPELESFHPLERPEGKFTNLNAGAALSLWRNPNGISAKLGLTGRYNKTTNTIGGGAGLVFSRANAIFGLGVTREKVSNFLPPTYFTSLVAGYRLWILEFEYTMLLNSAGVGLEPIHIATGTLHINRFLITAAARRLNYLSEGDVTQLHFALQALVSRSISVGLLYNFIPGTNSLALQYYL